MIIGLAAVKKTLEIIDRIVNYKLKIFTENKYK